MWTFLGKSRHKADHWPSNPTTTCRNEKHASGANTTCIRKACRWRHQEQKDCWRGVSWQVTCPDQGTLPTYWFLPTWIFRTSRYEDRSVFTVLGTSIHAFFAHRKFKLLSPSGRNALWGPPCSLKAVAMRNWRNARGSFSTTIDLVYLAQKRVCSWKIVWLAPRSWGLEL